MPNPAKQRLEIAPRDRIYRDVEAPVQAGAVWKDGSKNQYGPYKLSGAEAQRFLNGPEGTPWKRELGNLKPETDDFNRKWQEVGRAAAEPFDDSQAKFANATRFEPQADRIRQATGIEVRDRSSAVQNVVFAGAMKYGGESDIMSRAIDQKARRLGKDFEKMSDAEIMGGILDERSHMEPGFAPQLNKEREYGDHLLNLENDMQEELRKNPQADLSGFGTDTPVAASETWQRGDAAQEMAMHLVQGEMQPAMNVDPVQAVVGELKKSVEKSMEEPKQKDIRKGVEDVNLLGWMGGRGL